MLECNENNQIHLDDIIEHLCTYHDDSDLEEIIESCATGQKLRIGLKIAQQVPSDTLKQYEQLLDGNANHSSVKAQNFASQQSTTNTNKTTKS